MFKEYIFVSKFHTPNDDQTGMRDGYHKSVVIEKQVPQVPQCGTKCGTNFKYEMMIFLMLQINMYNIM